MVWGVRDREEVLPVPPVGDRLLLFIERSRDEKRAAGVENGAGCKTIAGERRKCSGLFWSVCGANAILALCCRRRSGSFEDDWEARSGAA
jgi:hypothetical protein